MYQKLQKFDIHVHWHGVGPAIAMLFHLRRMSDLLYNCKSCLQCYMKDVVLHCSVFFKKNKIVRVREFEFEFECNTRQHSPQQWNIRYRDIHYMRELHDGTSSNGCIDGISYKFWCKSDTNETLYDLTVFSPQVCEWSLNLLWFKPKTLWPLLCRLWPRRCKLWPPLYMPLPVIVIPS